ncbi:MAG: pantoate--beta-alanine ligase [Candidatus Omnitrophica bacterium]|nr:pantoate--beta-alanine ligase [Candidatus Omnitrophota bacterium]
MRVIRSPKGLRDQVRQARCADRSVGFIPTMGALHEGHLSLIRAARKRDDLVIVSVYVNPLQFGPKEDLGRYPGSLAQDRHMAAGAGADLLFAPSDKLMYPAAFQSRVEVLLLQQPLCGKSRPGHFSGVSTVVAKLLNLVQPDRLYLGQKDYQQALLLRRMVRDLDWPVQVCLLPTVREHDGLALSSRNAYLSAPDRQVAPALRRGLREAAKALKEGSTAAVALRRAKRLWAAEAPQMRIDYLEAVDAGDLSPVQGRTQRILLAAAVWLGKTRLIDNIVVHRIQG